jgi:CheY-specific phosphatase CheX
MDSVKSAGIFVKAIKNVLEEYCLDIDNISDSVPSDTKYIETLGLDVLIYLFEEIDGIMVLSMGMDTAMHIAKAIDIDPDGVDEAVTREVIAEVGNLTAARSSGMFSKRGLKSNITPPSVFCGKGSQIYCPVPDVMRTVITGEYGEVVVYSAVRKKEKKVVYV